MKWPTSWANENLSVSNSSFVGLTLPMVLKNTGRAFTISLSDKMYSGIPPAATFANPQKKIGENQQIAVVNYP
jgi:hypothetical protein